MVKDRQDMPVYDYNQSDFCNLSVIFKIQTCYVVQGK